jgi:hypothetical protein
MKKLRNYGIVLISLLVLLGSCFTAAATSIDDGTSDVWHWTFTFTGGRWDGNIGNKPNIDIKEISYSVNDNKITLKMEVSGEIQTSDKIAYMVYYNTTDTTYQMSYSNGTGGGFGMNQENMDIRATENVSVSGDTFSVVLDVIGDTSKVDLWGYAAEYSSYGDLSAEWWGDWAPNEKFLFDTGTDGTDGTNGTDGTDGGLDDKESGSDKKTPGFELVLVLAAVAVVFIVLRKRR